MTIVRMGPSGKRLQPSPANGLSSWDASAPVSFELLPARHLPGIYSFTIGCFVLVPASSGNLSISCAWDAPGFGPTNVIFANNGNINAGFLAPRNVMTSGDAAMVLTFTPANIVGTPRLSLNVPIEFIFSLLPEGYPS